MRETNNDQAYYKKVICGNNNYFDHTYFAVMLCY